jgi:cytochrome P450
MQAWGLERGLPFTPYRSALDARDRIVAYLRNIVESALERYYAGESLSRSSFTLLLDACEAEGVKIGVGEGEEFEILLYNLVFLMFAGTGTTVLSMQSVAKVFVREPELLERAGREQDELLIKHGGEIDRHVRTRSHTEICPLDSLAPLRSYANV